MNITVKENIMENLVDIEHTFGITQHGAVNLIRQDTAVSSNHSLKVLIDTLSKVFQAFVGFGSGRINEQRLTCRDPWLEVYTISRDFKNLNCGVKNECDVRSEKRSSISQSDMVDTATSESRSFPP